MGVTHPDNLHREGFVKLKAMSSTLFTITVAAICSRVFRVTDRGMSVRLDFYQPPRMYMYNMWMHTSIPHT